LYGEGNTEAALEAAREAVAITREHLGEQHPKYARALDDLGVVCSALQNVMEAERLYQRALELRRVVLGEDHPDYAESQHNLAVLYQSMGRLAEAEPLYRGAMEIWCAVLGEDHPMYVASSQRLAALRQDLEAQANSGLAGDATTPEQCIQSFTDKNYAACVEQALGLMSSGATHEVLQVLLLSLERLGRADAVEQLAPRILAATSSADWDHRLLRLTLGQVDPAEVLRLADNDTRRCQVHYYWGARLLALGQIEPAQDAFNACLRFDASCLERQLAEVEKRFVPSPIRAASRREVQQQIGEFNRQAVRLYQQGRYEEAVPFATQACQLAAAAVDQQPRNYAACLNNLAAVYERMGRYSEAEPLLRQATEVCRVRLGENHPDHATSLQNLAAVDDSLGRPSEAEPLFRRALEIRRVALGEQHPEYAASLSGLAKMCTRLGRFSEAEPLYSQAAEITRVALGGDHPEYAAILHELATLYLSMGRYAEAEQHFRRAMEIRRVALGEQHPDYATSLNNLAVLYSSIARHAEVEQLLRQASETLRVAPGNGQQVYAASLNNLAALYTSMARHAEAEQLLRQASEIVRVALGEQHLEYAWSLNNLAVLYDAMGRYAEAKSLHGQALQIRRVVLGEQHPEYATSLNNLAALYCSLGQYAEAEPLLRQSTEIRRVVLGEQHPECAISLHNLAALLVATGRAADALALEEEAAAIHDHTIGQIFSIGSESQRTAYLQKLQVHFDGFLSLVQQHLPGSPSAVRAALDLVLRRKTIGAEALAAQRDAVLGGRYPHLKPQLDELDLLRRQIALKTLAGPGDEDPQIHQQTLATWTAQKERLEGELARQIPEISLEQQLHAASRDAVALYLPAATTLVEFVRFNVFDFHAVPARGEPRWKPARYLAFLLRAGRPDHAKMLDLGEAEPIDRLIDAFRQQTLAGEGRGRTLAGGSSRAEQRDFQPEGARAQRVPASSVGMHLRARIFDPLLPTLEGATRLLLSPDGDLTRLPFEVLPADDGTYLVDTYRISYVASGRDVLRSTARLTREPGPAVVAADPDFDLGGVVSEPGVTSPSSERPLAGRHSRDLDRASMCFSRLPGTRVEGERIAKLLDIEPWLEGEALESRLRARRSPRILHLATHGFFLEDQKSDPDEERGAFGMLSFGAVAERGRLLGRGTENPLLRSGLALAGVNTWLRHGTPPEEAEDGLLTAEDVTGLDLLDTELVVLSACETGLGEVRVGEGVFGLRRAFVLAGAKTLVMSLWKVPDVATAVLMVRFYENLLQNEMERDEALREAQRYLRQVTVGEIRAEWLSAEAIAHVSAGSEETRRELEEPARQPDEHRAYQHPLYWGAFICQGETRPLRPVRTAEPPAQSE
jgi:CHAT domain-containing protein/tetratricopeptide (TPR) repeat protein